MKKQEHPETITLSDFAAWLKAQNAKPSNTLWGALKEIIKERFR